MNTPKSSDEQAANRSRKNITLFWVHVLLAAAILGGFVYVQGFA